jgi:hypothetical protein
VDGARLEEVRAAAQELSETDLSILQDFVPYRFLTPWLRSALVGVNDHSRNHLSSVAGRTQRPFTAVDTLFIRRRDRTTKANRGQFQMADFSAIQSSSTPSLRSTFGGAIF